MWYLVFHIITKDFSYHPVFYYTRLNYSSYISMWIDIKILLFSLDFDEKCVSWNKVGLEIDHRIVCKTKILIPSQSVSDLLFFFKVDNCIIGLLGLFSFMLRFYCFSFPSSTPAYILSIILPHYTYLIPMFSISSPFFK